MKSRALIATVGTVWTFGFSPEEKRINPGTLPMPVFSPPNRGTVLTRTSVPDMPGQWQGEINSLFR